jgi:hypothetical protein
MCSVFLEEKVGYTVRESSRIEEKNARLPQGRLPEQDKDYIKGG